MNILSLIAGLAKNKYFWAVVIFILLIVGVYLSFTVKINNLSQRAVYLQNELARRDTMYQILDNAYTRLGIVSEELRTENLDLQKLIKEKDAKIFALAKIKQTTSIDSIYLVPKDSVFSFQNEWISLWGKVYYQGEIKRVLLGELKVRDSLQVLFTQDKNGIIRGYVQNFSPYVKVNNLQFEVAQNVVIVEKPILQDLAKVFVGKDNHLKPTTYIYAAGTGASVGILANGRLSGALIGAATAVAIVGGIDYLILAKGGK